MPLLEEPSTPAQCLRDVPEERHVDLDQCQSDDFGSAQRKGMCASIIGCLLANGEPNTVNCTVEH